MIEGDARQPAFQIGTALVLVDMQGRLQEGLLRRVLGLIRIAQERVRQVVDEIVVSQHQRLADARVDGLAGGLPDELLDISHASGHSAI